MKLFYLTDTHWRDEEPFYVAASRMVDHLLKNIELYAEGDEFLVVHGGDVFNKSKETGRVNGLVVKFFSRLLKIPNCKRVYVLQGNHDVKKETGSALDCLPAVNGPTDSRLHIIKTPTLLPLPNGKYMYLLPYMVSYSFEKYETVATYGDPEFHIPFIQDKADDIMFTFAHIGDETSGEFFAQADISFLPGMKCNGHVHKRVSEHYPGSAMVTRRDEADKPCVMRQFDLKYDYTRDDPANPYEVCEISLGLAINYWKVDFNADLGAAFGEWEYKPYGSVIVDVKGHDSAEAVSKWFDEQKTRLPLPAFLGSVYPDEKASDGDYSVGGGEKQEMNLREIFADFCKEKNVADPIRERIEAMLC